MCRKTRARMRSAHVSLQSRAARSRAGRVKPGKQSVHKRYPSTGRGRTPLVPSARTPGACLNIASESQVAESPKRFDQFEIQAKCSSESMPRVDEQFNSDDNHLIDAEELRARHVDSAPTSFCSIYHFVVSCVLLQFFIVVSNNFCSIFRTAIL